MLDSRFPVVLNLRSRFKDPSRGWLPGQLGETTIKMVFILQFMIKTDFINPKMNICIYMINIFTHNSIDANTSFSFHAEEYCIHCQRWNGTSRGLLHVYVCYRMCSHSLHWQARIVLITRISLSTSVAKSSVILCSRCLCFVCYAIFHIVQKINTLLKKEIHLAIEHTRHVYNKHIMVKYCCTVVLIQQIQIQMECRALQ